ncbi:MAG: dTDP-4-dehydrorhamnose reductase [Promethearchaeota archaeon]
MKVLILGANGQLGSEFKTFLKNKAEIFALNHNELNVLDFKKLVNTFKEISPDVVINCAAYTKVDQVEEEENLAYQVNAVGAKNVSFASFKVKAKVVYFSTDYVFDGAKELPYREFDKPNPLSIYGKSKLFGEEFTKQFNPNHLILRISWLYGINGSNFVKSIAKLAKGKGKLKVVNDQIGTPTYTLDVVKQTWQLIQNDSVGLYHCSNTGQTNWFEFAKKIVGQFNLNAKVLSIKTNEFPALAKRPSFSVLENYLLKIENKNIMRSWEEAFNDFVNKYKKKLINE